MALYRPIPVSVTPTIKMAAAIGGVMNGFTIVGDTYTHTSTSSGTGVIGTIDDLTFSYQGSNVYKVVNAGASAVEITNLVSNETKTIPANGNNTFTSSQGFATVL